MIALCLIRIATLEASRMANVSVGQLSFARALTETRLFLKLLLSPADVHLRHPIWAEYVQQCAEYRVHSKPDRQFPRDRQGYRKKSRRLDTRKPGRKRKFKAPTPLPPQSETLKDSKGVEFLLG